MAAVAATEQHLLIVATVDVLLSLAFSNAAVGAEFARVFEQFQILFDCHLDLFPRAVVIHLPTTAIGRPHIDRIAIGIRVAMVIVARVSQVASIMVMLHPVVVISAVIASQQHVVAVVLMLKLLALLQQIVVC